MSREFAYARCVSIKYAVFSIVFLLVASLGVAAETKITLQASDISLPAPWVYNTGPDSPGGGWLAPWSSQSSVSATVNVGQVLAPGTYRVFIKALDYDNHNTCTVALGGGTSATATFEDRDATGYWSTNISVTSVSSASSMVFNFFRAAPNIQNLRLMAIYITSDPGETVLRDDRVMVFRYPGTSENDNSAAIKGNHVPNSSFECGIGAFWRYVSLSGRTNTLRELWSSDFAWHGTRALRVPCPELGGQAYVESNPLTLASNKVHTVSVYVRSGSGSNTASLYITSLYQAPTGFTPTYTAGIGQNIGTGWTRMSLTTTNLPFYPNGQYFITFAVQKIDGGNLYFDGVQVEEGDASAWQPKNDFEFDVTTSEPTQVFWTNDVAPTLTVRAWNNAAGSSSKQIDYSVLNWKNAESWSGSLNLTVSSSNANTATIAVPLTEKGHFRGEFGIASQDTDSEVTWLVIAPPPTTGLDPDSNFGGLMDASPFMLRRVQRLGVKWHVTTSTGRLRIEDTKTNAVGGYVWPDMRAFTNHGVSVLGSIESQVRPSWVLNAGDFLNYADEYTSNAVMQYPFITHWNIWNEPPGVLGSMSNYVEFLRIAATRIKAINPALHVIGGGGTDTATKVTNMWAMLGADAGKVDTVSVHLYPGNESSAVAIKSDVIDGLGKQVWNTESGTAPDQGSFTGSRRAFREAGRYALPWQSGATFYTSLFGNSEIQSKNFLTCLAYGLTKMFYFDFAMRQVSAGDFTSPQWTAVEYDESFRAKAAALAGIFSLLDKSVGQGPVNCSDSTVSAFAYLRGTTPLVTIWAPTNKTIVLAGSVSAANLRVSDLMGNSAVPSSLALNIGRMPQIIEGQGAMSLSNLVYAFEHGIVSDRADTSPPQLVITAWPKICAANLVSHFRWLALDDYGTPNELLAYGITYRYRLDGGAWSSWTGDTWVNYNKLAGTHEFEVEARDLAGNVSQASVQGPAVAAVDDFYSAVGGTTLTVAAPGVLANDDALNGNALTTVLVSNPTHGTLNLNANGAFTYTPNPNYAGSDTFTYRAKDGALTSSVATVRITITLPPVANNDPYTTPEDSVLTIAAPGVLGNDTNLDGDALQAVLVSAPTHGTLNVNLNTNGSFTYTPAANYNGPDSFTYRATDGVLTSAVATVTITVTPVNDPPIAANDSATTTEDVAVTINVLLNDTDLDGDTLTISSLSSPAHGSLGLNPNGSIMYTPVANYTGPDSFTYRATDGVANTGIATVSITVNPVNDGPVANNDAYITPEDTTLAIGAAGVLGNDTDPDGNPLTAVLVAAPAHGTLALNANGGFSYTPTNSYHGPDSFTYRATDGTVNSGIATVSITVTAANDSPVALNDARTTPEDTGVTIPVLTNDSDVDGDTLVIISVSPTNGTASISGTNVVFTPTTNFVGTATIGYTISDGNGGTDTALITVTVTAVNDAPVANNDTYITTEGTVLNVSANGVLANDNDPDGNPLTAILANGPAHGTLTLSANGGVIYTPTNNYNGSDSFTYRANDGTVNSGIATVSITVTAVNDSPVAVNDARTTPEDTGVTIPVLTNDSDVDGDTLVIISVSPTNGTASISGTNVVFTPATNFVGTATIGYTISDGNGGTDTGLVTVNVTPINDPPLAVNDSASTLMNQQVTIPVLVNDSDVDGNVLTITSATTTNGTVTVSGTNLVFLAALNYSGAVTLTYVIGDGSLSSTALVSVAVGFVNLAPVANNDSAATPEDTRVTIPVLVNDSDPNDDVLTIIAASPTNGTVSIVGTNLSFLPATNFVGAATVGYTTSDGSLSATAVVTVTVTAVNDPPLAGNDSTNTLEDVSVTIKPLLNDSDVDGDTLTITTVSPTNGTASIAGTNVVFTPATNFVGTATIGYTISDGHGGNAAALISVTVSEVNDAPVANNDTYIATEDTALNVPASGVLANDTDPDGNPLTAILATGPAHGTLTLNANGGFIYTPTNNYNGSDSFTYRAKHGNADSGLATVTIAVLPVNDMPVATNDTYTALEDTTLTIAAPGVLANDLDVDGDPLLTVLVSTVSHGTLNLTTNGAFVYTPSLNYTGADTFTYRAADGSLASEVATVTIETIRIGRPALQATFSEGKVIVSWPSSATNYVLESSVTMPSTNWVPVSVSPFVSGDRNLLTNPPTGPALFFRLRSPGP